MHKVIAAMLNNIFNLSSSSTSFIAWTAEIKIDIEVIIWSMRSSGFRWISQKILYLHEYISEIKNVFTYASLCIDWKCMIYWQQITQVSYVCDYLKKYLIAFYITIICVLLIKLACLTCLHFSRHFCVKIQLFGKFY